MVVSDAAEGRVAALETGALFPLVARLAVPSIIGVSVSAVYQVLNAFFVGKLGTHATAAMAVTFPIAMLLTAVGQCFGVGTASIVARSLGRNDRGEANRFATAGVVCGTAVAGLLAVLLIVIARSLLTLLGATPNTLSMGLTYASWLLVGYVANVFNMVCGFIVRAEGNTRFSMATQIAAFATNALFDPVFIFVCKLGIAGAGAATLLGQSFAGLMYISYFSRQRGTVKLCRLRPVLLHNHGLAIVRIGGSSAIGAVAGMLSLSALNRVAAPYGDGAVAGIGIASRLVLVATLPVSGLCIGAQSVLGFNLGARNWVRVKEAVSVIVRLALAFTGCYAAIIFLTASDVVQVFSGNVAVLNVARRAVQIFHLGLPLFAVQAVTMALLQAKGEAARASLLAVARPLMVPLLVVMKSCGGLGGLMLAQLSIDGIIGALAVILLIRELRRLGDGGI